VRLDLPGKDLFKTMVVADRRQDGRIRRQGDGGETRTLHREATHQFCRNVLRVGRAPAISCQQDLAPGLQTGNTGQGRALDRGDECRICEHRGQHPPGLADLVTNLITHGLVHDDYPAREHGGRCRCVKSFIHSLEFL
jgi:hypothetical protein